MNILDYPYIVFPLLLGLIQIEGINLVFTINFEMTRTRGKKPKEVPGENHGQSLEPLNKPIHKPQIKGKSDTSKTSQKKEDEELDFFREYQKPTVQILTKLKKNLSFLKQTLSKAQTQYQECAKNTEILAVTIASKKQSITSAEQTILQTEKTMIQKSIGTDKILFFNPFTFQDNSSFELFYRNFIEVPQQIQACSMVDNQESMIKFYKLNRVNIERICSWFDNSIQKEAIVRHFDNFPYLCCELKSELLLKQLLSYKEQKFVDKNDSILRVMSPLFMRYSALSDKLVLKIMNFISNLLFNDSNDKFFSALLQVFAKKYPSIQLSRPQIENLASKAILSVDYICLPGMEKQIRGFCHNQKVYINTYYIQKQENCCEETKVVYCSCAILRQIVNMTEIELNKDKFKTPQINAIKQILVSHWDRTDSGSKMERILSEREGFACADSSHYSALRGQTPDYSILGDSHQNSILYEEFEIMKREKIKEISNKYLDYEGEDQLSKLDQKIDNLEQILFQPPIQRK